MNLNTNCENIIKGAKILYDKFLGSVEVSAEPSDCLRVLKKNDKYKIGYSEISEFYRAMSVIKSNIDAEEFSVIQKRKFSTCGIMLDASRNAVPKIETVKRLIEIMASMGMNMLMLYTEDTYKLPSYPYFGYMRGAYSEDEIKEIVEYAEIFGVEVVACIQTLAHLTKALRWRDFLSVKESEDILFVGEEETYKLIDEMFSVVSRCFKSKKIHIGMDEAHNIGLGGYLEKHGYTNRFDILSYHLNRVNEIAKKYGFEPMMWSDMFFRLASPTGDYYDFDAKLPENISDLIPEGVSQVYWDYYNTDKSLYEFMISEHKKCKGKLFLQAERGHGADRV